MLTKDEKDYLEKIPADEKVVVRPYDSLTTEIAGEFIAMIKSVDPKLEVAHLGASALGISIKIYYTLWDYGSQTAYCRLSSNELK